MRDYYEFTRLWREFNSNYDVTASPRNISVYLRNTKKKLRKVFLQIFLRQFFYHFCDTFLRFFLR